MCPLANDLNPSLITPAAIWGPLVGIADHPPRLKIEPRRDLDHAHARARPQWLDDHVEDDGLSDPHGKHHQRPAREFVGLGRAREAIDDKVGSDDQHKRQHQLSRNEFTANPQGRNDLVAGQANVDEDAERGKPFAAHRSGRTARTSITPAMLAVSSNGNSPAASIKRPYMLPMLNSALEIR